ncbi:hypothetical protein [Kutzneria sp. 744]|uniref:hypothetical protein n=1 Tax=Kutzneria sp. (strain 744) TaxID=345341 RepID=UPI0003EEB46D|nr:hypothetical protein [Kutzneria sp. 744]EWM19715.1 hypothetical protein KUTG_10019 [Kutzneria sp. 744]
MSDTTPTHNVRTWADGFGRWHASVPLTDYAVADANKARALIIAELTEREGPQFDPSAVHVTRTSVTGHGTAVYSERVDD